MRPSTEEILLWHSVNKQIDSSWIDWATSQLEQGKDSPSLRILAGEAPPFNFFQMNALVGKALEELNLLEENKSLLLKKQIHFLLNELFSKKQTSEEILTALYKLYNELGGLSIDERYNYFEDFPSLYLAQNDLKTAEYQREYSSITINVQEKPSGWIKKLFGFKSKAVEVQDIHYPDRSDIQEEIFRYAKAWAEKNPI